MHTVEITLEQVLLARDRRVQRQQALHRQYGGTLLSFTMNIAGPVKDTPLVRLAFRAGLAALDRDLGAPVHRESVAAPTGPEALLVYHRPAGAVKDLCLRLEEQAPVGRLYDLDVLSPGGEKLSRPQSRRCLICGGPVTVCSRSRAHGLPAIRARTRDILADFAAGHLSALARQALEDEVDLTPKPGLVDRRNTGAHDDMDRPLFHRSAGALAPYFRQFAARGMAGASPRELQSLGREAEEAMLAATGGVNTHKGALYSFALLLSALGRCLAEGGDPFDTAAAIAAALPPAENTHGSAGRSQCGLQKVAAIRPQCGGVRQEAVSGFPTARHMRELLSRSGALAALTWSMSRLDDSTLVYRGGPEGLHYVQQAASALLALPENALAPALEALDDDLIARHLSPGGSADLLSLALFLDAASPETWL